MFMIKRKRKLGIEKLLSLIWSIYKNLQIIVMIELIFPMINEENNKIRTSASLLLNTVLQILAEQLGRKENKINGIQIRNRNLKISLFSDDVFLYITF